MALMRVYCGLAATNPTVTQEASNPWLTAAVVDDAGRLLDVCEIGDDAVGYAVLGALLAERSGGTATVAVAADSDEHQITLLLAAAGRPLAIVDDETVGDYADRFADDESPDEIEAAPAERSAVGLARALQAGALAAAAQGAPRDLMVLKPVLAAHASVAAGRHGTAVALREVLRELYPAALRAYPDPAEPIPLAILDALPEPGLLGTTNANRGRDASVTMDLASAGVADADTIADAITALRVAIAETPRRTGIGKGPTTAVAETIRQAVAAVRACDAAVAALVGLIAEKVAPRPVLAPVHAAAPPAALQQAPMPARRGRPAPAANLVEIPATRPITRNAPTRPSVSRTNRPAASVPTNVVPRYDEMPIAGASALAPPSEIPAYPIHPTEPVYPTEPSWNTGAYAVPAYPAVPTPQPVTEYRIPDVHHQTRNGYEPNAYPLSPDMPAPGSRDAWPLNPPDLDDQAARVRQDSQPSSVERGFDGPIPRQRDGRVAPPWQTDDLPLPVEPPALRLVEPEAPAAMPLSTTLPTSMSPLTSMSPATAMPLRLVGTDDGYADLSRPDAPRVGSGGRTNLGSIHLNGGPHRVERSAPPMPAPTLVAAPTEDEFDGDLLIFAQMRSAWFVGPEDEESTAPTWSEAADQGWSAAERASHPSFNEETEVGLPKRVPQANLVPGSPLPPMIDCGLRIVRDPASMAAHTTGYFRGSRRGEEVRGYAVGGRPGRESGGSWDFSRDSWENDRDTAFRFAARR